DRASKLSRFVLKAAHLLVCFRVMPEEKPVHIPSPKYPELTYPGTITTAVSETELEDVHLMDYWRVVVARRWMILAIVATVFAVTMIYTFKQTPIYQATATIQIDKENPN